MKIQLLVTNILLVLVMSNVYAMVRVDSCKFAVQGEVTHLHCYGGNDGAILLHLTGSPFVTFQWNNGQQTQNLEGLTAGSYSVRVSDEECSLSFSFQVTQPEKPLAASVTRLSPVTCPDGSDGMIVLEATGGTPPYAFTKGYENETSSSGHFDNLKPDLYQITIADANGCVISQTAELTNPAQVDIDLGPDLRAIAGEPITLNAGPGYETYRWSTGDDNQHTTIVQEADVEVTLTVHVIVTDDNGCAFQSNDLLITFVPSSTGLQEAEPANGEEPVESPPAIETEIPESVEHEYSE